jgi:hypothetical protein
MHTLRTGDWFFESRFLSKGRLILLNLTAAHGVISLTTHADVWVYIGLVEPQSSTPVWYEPPSEVHGFLVFGQCRALVELVAAEDMTLSYSCQFISDSSTDCTEVLSGSSLLYRFRNYSNRQSRMCFLPTDSAVSADITGVLGGSTLTVVDGAAPSVYEVLPPNGTRFGTVRSVVLRGGENAANLDIQFTGGSDEYNYDRVTLDSGPCVMGKGECSEYKALEADPVYPDSRDKWNFLVWILFAFATLSIFVVGSVLTLYTFVTERRGGLNGGESELYDRQEHIDREPNNNEEMTNDSETAQEAAEKMEDFPNSPYDRSCLPL